MLLTYANTHVNNTVADATKIEEDKAAIQTVLNGNIDHDNIVDGGVGTLELEDGAVTTGKMATGSVTEAVLRAGAVTNTKLGDGSATAAKLGAASVRDAKIEYTRDSDGVKLLRTGPGIAQMGTEGLRLARCMNVVTTGKTGATTVTITFASAALDGDPAFSADPEPVGWVYKVQSAVATDYPTFGYIYSDTATEIVFKLIFSATPTAVQGTLYTTWIGRTAT
jgi:hypothetical protein